MKKFLNAVIYGGIALFVGVILGLFIDGALNQFNPEAGSLTELAVEYFLPAYMVSLVIGVLLLIVTIADEV